MGINRGTVLDLINDVHRAGGFKDYNSYSYIFDQVDTMPESKEDAKLSTLKIERAISGLTEWQKHVQTDSDIDRDISVAVKVLKAQLSTNLAEVGTDCGAEMEVNNESN